MIRWTHGVYESRTAHDRTRGERSTRECHPRASAASADTHETAPQSPRATRHRHPPQPIHSRWALHYHYTANTAGPPFVRPSHEHALTAAARGPRADRGSRRRSERGARCPAQSSQNAPSESGGHGPERTPASTRPGLSRQRVRPRWRLAPTRRPTTSSPESAVSVAVECPVVPCASTTGTEPKPQRPTSRAASVRRVDSVEYLGGSVRVRSARVADALACRRVAVRRCSRSTRRLRVAPGAWRATPRLRPWWGPSRS